MRILIVNTRHFYGGGDSTYAFNLANLLRFHDHEVSFFAMRDERNLGDPNSDLFVSNIDFKEINERQSLVSGIRVFSRVIYSREAEQNFSKLLERVQPDIVHLQNIHGHISPSVIFVAKKRGLPVVWTLHDYKMVCPNSHFLIDRTGEICEACLSGHYGNAISKRCKKGSMLASTMAAIEAYAHRSMKIRDKIDIFLAPSAFLRSKLLQAGFNPRKVIHVPLFLPDEMFSETGGDKGYILFMTKLDAIKGIYPLLEACRNAPDVRLKMAGRIEEGLAKDLLPKLPPNVEYLGMQHGEALRRLLLDARAVVLPSLWYENQPFAVTEAFAAGKPVLASNLGGMTELIKHGERGLLLPAGDVNAWASALNWVAKHAEEARQMGIAAREYAVAFHSSGKHYHEIERIYSGLGTG
jgi:glycosyltransferase involved in cell wall biosynthesis